jgi:predicted Zn-dependent peptidase
LINQYQTGLDAPGGIVEHWLVDCMSNRLPAENVIESLQQVTKEQVANLAKKLQLQAVYFYGMVRNNAAIQIFGIQSKRVPKAAG